VESFLQRIEDCIDFVCFVCCEIFVKEYVKYYWEQLYFLQPNRMVVKDPQKWKAMCSQDDSLPKVGGTHWLEGRTE